MTKKHTPGPWAFLDTGLVFAGKNRLHIAQVATTGMGYQAAGNAALIAAAPELLKALQMIEEAASGRVPLVNNWVASVARAAIDKANGEQA